MIKVDLRCVMSYVSLVVNLTFNNIQLYREVQFSWLSKPEYMEKPSSTDCKPLTNFIEYTLPWNHFAYSFSKYINGIFKMHASQFYHDPRDNDENVCKIPVFNNLRLIHKLWYKQPRKKYLSVRIKNVLLFVVQDTAQKSQHV